jgi:predicted nucleic acid-binding protein
MSDTADLNLVLARILPQDALHARAVKHLKRANPVVPFAVGLELLFVARRFKFTCVEALGAAEGHFQIEGREVLFTAAEALDSGEVSTVFDAVHLADALHRGGRLHTADKQLLKSPFPTENF